MQASKENIARKVNGGQYLKYNGYLDTGRQSTALKKKTWCHKWVDGVCNKVTAANLKFMYKEYEDDEYK